MAQLPDQEIIQLYQSFGRLGSYAEKLAFFDRHFTILPYSLVSFNRNVSFLSDAVEVERLKTLYKMESVRSVCLRKEFNIGAKHFVFDVTPANSTPPVFNQFIINKFLLHDVQFNKSCAIIAAAQKIEGISASSLLEEAEQVLLYVKECIRPQRNKQFRAQLAKVFMTGYGDEASKNIKSFRYRKKIIELNIYAQGILYRKFVGLLNNLSLSLPAETDSVMLPESQPLDWPDQIQLMNRMGVIDLLKQKVQLTHPSVYHKPLQKLVCRIIGQEPVMAEAIGQYLRRIEKS